MNSDPQTREPLAIEQLVTADERRDKFPPVVRSKAEADALLEKLNANAEEDAQ